MARTIQSPGVEINEVDLSLRPDLPAGTNILIPGFSPAGPVDEVIQMASLSEFEQVYGLPTNAAERYFYHTVRAAFQSPGNIYVSRLPYGSQSGYTTAEGQYSVTLYPVRAKNYSAYSTVAGLSGEGNYTPELNPDASTAALSAIPEEYEIMPPLSIEINQDEYQKLIDGEFTWSNSNNGVLAGTNIEKIQSAGIVVLNNKSLTINEKFEGYYLNFADANDFYPNSAYASVSGVKSINKSGSYRTVNPARLAFPLTSPADQDANYVEGSLSEVVENLPEFNISTDEFADLLVMSVFKLRKSTLDPDTEKLDFVLTESYVGSLNENRVKYDPNGGGEVSMSLKDITAGSPNFQLFINKNISNTGDWVDRDGDEIKVKRKMKVDTRATNLYAHGVYKEVSGVSSTVGNIPTKLGRVFELIDNHELFPLDLTLEAGLGTIFAATNGGTDTENFDDEKQIILDPSGQDKLFTPGLHQFNGPVIWYRNVANKFVEFAEKKRKDHMCILDPIRHIFVQGANSTTMGDPNKNFSQHIYWPLRHIYSSINSSYAATYGNWARVFDGQLGRNIWAPMSGYIAATYANTDANFQPWFAPAGFTRGVLTGVADIAVYPKQKHRDQLYKININPIANFPNDGFVVFGQKTMQTKPSAFDRVNVRRLFLYLEKATRATVKYFVFEPNTLFTRTQVGNVLAPIFDRAKNTQGMYDYLLICDERNNTPDVIDQNEMVIDIYIKPVRAAEFILVNFYATRTGQDFSELVS